MRFRRSRPKSFQLLSWRHASSAPQLAMVPEHEPLPATTLTQNDCTFSEEVQQEFAAFDFPSFLQPQSAGSDSQSLLIAGAGASGTPDTDMNITQPTQPNSQTVPEAMLCASDSIQRPPRRRKPRYYSQALTHEDKQALARGVENHNLKTWTPTDLVMHNEQLLDLDPLPLITDHSSQSSMVVDAHGRTTPSSSRHFRTGDAVRFLQYSEPTPRVSQFCENLEVEINHFETEFQREFEANGIGSPLYSSRSSSAPAFDQFPDQPAHSHSAPVLPVPPRGRAPTRPDIPEIHLHRAHSYSPISRPYAHPNSCPLSLSPARTYRSQDSTDFKANPETTFESFLGPHKSGKGETHADYVKHKKVADKEARLRRVRKSLMLGWERKSSGDSDIGSGSRSGSLSGSRSESGSGGGSEKEKE